MERNRECDEVMNFLVCSDSVLSCAESTPPPSGEKRPYRRSHSHRQQKGLTLSKVRFLKKKSVPLFSLETVVVYYILLITMHQFSLKKRKKEKGWIKDVFCQEIQKGIM